MKRLSNHLTDIWPKLIKGFEEHINKIWESTYFETFSEWKKSQDTQTVTQTLSGIFNAYLKKELKNIGFHVKAGKRMDYLWDDIEIEGKLSCSVSESWTGNGFPKTNWHLLIKLSFNSDGLLNGSFVCLVPLNECLSSWTKSGEKDNFSSLKLRKEDLEKIFLIWGQFKKNPTYLKPIFV